MNEHIIQLLQNEDDNNRLLGIHLAVGDGWSVDDIFKWLLKDEYNDGHYTEWGVNNITLEHIQYDKDLPPKNRIWITLEDYDQYMEYNDSSFETSAEYQAKFIELLLN